jgi:hypothetical protein
MTLNQEHLFYGQNRLMKTWLVVYVDQNYRHTVVARKAQGARSVATGTSQRRDLLPDAFKQFFLHYPIMDRSKQA